MKDGMSDGAVYERRAGYRIFSEDTRVDELVQQYLDERVRRGDVSVGEFYKPVIEGLFNHEKVAGDPAKVTPILVAEVYKAVTSKKVDKE